MTDDASAPTLPDTGGPSRAAASPSRPSAPDPRYAMQTLLGRGGMGEVWLAHDARIGRDVAIKVMRGDARRDPDAVARFVREARVQGRLEHPSIVPVHDLGGDEAAPFFAMKRLAGTTLADVLAAQARGDRVALERWPRRTLLARLVDACLAVELAHQGGVIHRDLKPANIMLGDFGETYVLDWGIARIADEADPDVIRTSDLRGDSAGGAQTLAGAMLGTPGYMAPEQMRGEAIDRRADVYALGCVLFEILTGVPAVPRDRLFEVTLAAACHRPSATSTTVDVPPELDDLCARTTAADPVARPESARAIADAIQRFLDGDRDLERRRALAAEHARRAIEVFERGGEAARPDAIREAGRAIALDPSSGEAQAVVMRVVIRAPAEIPAEAQNRIDADRLRAAHTALRGGMWVYLVFLGFLPIFKVLGVAETWPLVVVGVELATLAVLSGYGARLPRPPHGGLLAFGLGLHVATVATGGLFLGSFLIAPILVFGSLPVLLILPLLRAPRLLVALHLLALALPFTLEALGVVPRSFELSSAGLLLHPWAIHVTPTALLFVLLATVLGQMLLQATLLSRQRRDQDRSLERVHVQAWQLAQLVPEHEVAS